jgi:hypothetical protein
MFSPSLLLTATRVFGVFVATTGVLLTVLPKPLVPVDYLMIGVLSTLVSMATLFISLVGINSAMPIRRRVEPLPPDTPQSSAADQHS